MKNDKKVRIGDIFYSRLSPSHSSFNTFWVVDVLHPKTATGERSGLIKMILSERVRGDIDAGEEKPLFLGPETRPIIASPVAEQKIFVMETDNGDDAVMAVGIRLYRYTGEPITFLADVDATRECEDCGNEEYADLGGYYKYEPDTWLCDDCLDERMES